jgi:predicted DNA-binding transcriptional regulator YafY
MNCNRKNSQINRIIKIIKELYSLKKLYIRDLSDIYCVTQKTIYRDFIKINNIIPLKNKRGYYWIEPSSLQESQKLPIKLMQSFASNVNVEINCMPKNEESISMITFAIAYNSINKKIAEAIIKSIEQSVKCQFKYTNNKQESSKKVVSPIKLLTEKGKWYLVAKDTKDNVIKNYDFLKIKEFEVTRNKSHLNSKDINYAAKITSVWASHNKKLFDVTIFVDSYAKHYIDEMPLHITQKLSIPYNDGSAEYVYKITNKMELLPKIKEWLPHIYILEPIKLKEELKKDIAKYLKYIDNFS